MPAAIRTSDFPEGPGSGVPQLGRRRLTRRVALLAVGILGCWLGAAGSANAAPGSDATVVATDPPFQLDVGSVGGMEYTCAGGRALGGGISPGYPTFRVSRSTPTFVDESNVSSRWLAEGTNVGGSPVNVRAFAICSSNSDATFVIGNPVTLAQGDVLSDAVTCPAGTRVIGGGAVATGSTTVLELNGPLDASGLTANTDDGDVAAYWYAYMRNTGTTLLGARVWAECSAGSDAIIEATTLPVLGSSLNGAVAACPGGRRAVSGGVGLPGATVDSEIAETAPVDETLDPNGIRTGDVARGWRAKVKNNLGDRDYKVFAICLSDSPAPPSAGPSGPTGARAAALAKCKKKHTKKARKKCRRKAARLPA
jgi:hypothetical protein